MIVKCPACAARFRLDREKLAGKRVTMRCARCRHPFKVELPHTQRSKAAKQVRDLGVECEAGCRRARAVMNQRMLRAKARSVRVRPLWRWIHKTGRFQRSNLAPVCTFGIAAYGCIGTQMKQMRFHAAACG